MSAELPDDASDDAPDDALDLLRESQDRVLEREGIPMLLALVDETALDADGSREAAGAEGDRLARLLDLLAEALAPTGRDDDLGRTAVVLQAAAYRDFGQGRTVL